MTTVRATQAPSLYYGRKGKIEEAHSILTHFEREAVIHLSSPTTNHLVDLIVGPSTGRTEREKRKSRAASREHSAQGAGRRLAGEQILCTEFMKALSS
jgi:hypothetical protein